MWDSASTRWDWRDPIFPALGLPPGIPPLMRDLNVPARILLYMDFTKTGLKNNYSLSTKIFMIKRFITLGFHSK